MAIKWGMNPNSSSLGVDVTFLLAGATALALVTPIVGLLLAGRTRLGRGARSSPSSAEKPADVAR